MVTNGLHVISGYKGGEENEEGVGNFGIEKREGWQTESEEEKRERRFRGIGFSCFSFLSKRVPRESILKRRRGRNSSWAFKDRESPGEAFLVFLVLFV